jgi:hypothetical protein
MTLILKCIPLLALCSTTFGTESEVNVVHSEPAVNTELKTIDCLVESTEQTLKILVELKEQIKNYQDLEMRARQEADDKLLYALAKQAYQILNTLKTYHLTANFDTTFIEELSIVSKPFAKRAKPQ